MDDVRYGDYGVLAYDAAADRVQCHACGEWYHMLSGEHLQRHGLTAAAYEERYGLAPTRTLESPRVTALRLQNKRLTEAQRVPRIPDETLYGERGVLAYDELMDHIQCHACGRWYQKITAGHLRRHGLTIAEYKELYGLNVGTALETPRITELRRQQVEQTGAKDRLVPVQKGVPAPGAGHGHRRRAQYIRTYHTPERLQEMNRRRRRWSDEEMLAALHTLQAEAGGILTRYYLDHRANEPGELFPRSLAVVRRFGSWRRVCELLGQPYRTTRLPAAPGEGKRWSDAAIVEALRALEAELDHPLSARHLFQMRSGRKGAVGTIPSYKTVYDRFGSWRRIRELMDQRNTADERGGQHDG